MSLQLITRCCDGDATEEELLEMCAIARPVSKSTFFRKVSLRDVSTMLGYASGSAKGMHLKDDYLMQNDCYFRSVFRGKPVYYLVWSAIEHIFG